MSPEPGFPHPIRKLALATKPPPNNGFNLSLGVDALTILGQSFFRWPFSPHPKHASLFLGDYGPPMPSAFSFWHIVGLGLKLLVHMFVLFALLTLLPRVVVLAHLGWSHCAARLLLVHRVIPNLSAIRMSSCRLSGN